MYLVSVMRSFFGYRKGVHTYQNPVVYSGDPDRRICIKGTICILYILCVIITFVYLIAAVKLYADEILRIPEKPETKAGEQEDHVPDEEYYGD